MGAGPSGSFLKFQSLSNNITVAKAPQDLAKCRHEVPKAVWNHQMYKKEHSESCMLWSRSMHRVGWFLRNNTMCVTRWSEHKFNIWPFRINNKYPKWVKSNQQAIYCRSRSIWHVLWYFHGIPHSISCCHVKTQSVPRWSQRNPKCWRLLCQGQWEQSSSIKVGHSVVKQQMCFCSVFDRTQS